jgi:predicted Fe-S protein YdhL (DUF1289 family)
MPRAYTPEEEAWMNMSPDELAQILERSSQEFQKSNQGLQQATPFLDALTMGRAGAISKARGAQDLGVLGARAGMLPKSTAARTPLNVMQRTKPQRFKGSATPARAKTAGPKSSATKTAQEINKKKVSHKVSKKPETVSPPKPKPEIPEGVVHPAPKGSLVSRAKRTVTGKATQAGKYAKAHPIKTTIGAAGAAIPAYGLLNALTGNKVEDERPDITKHDYPERAPGEIGLWDDASDEEIEFLMDAARQEGQQNFDRELEPLIRQMFAEELAQGEKTPGMGERILGVISALGNATLDAGLAGQGIDPRRGHDQSTIAGHAIKRLEDPRQFLAQDLLARAQTEDVFGQRYWDMVRQSLENQKLQSEAALTGAEAQQAQVNAQLIGAIVARMLEEQQGTNAATSSLIPEGYTE